MKLSRVRCRQPFALGLAAGALALQMMLGCARGKPQPSPDERLRIAEWQTMVASARSESALSELRTRANAGMVAAQSALGRALSQQPDGPLRTEGVRWLRAASEAGDCPALLALGKLELSGTGGVPLDYAAARAHLTAAAERGEPRANYYLGTILRNGYGVPKDHDAAAQQFEIAARAGIPQACFMLANAYREGDGVPRNNERALALYEQAAEQDHPEAIQALAMAHQNGELGLPRDPELFRSSQLELEHAQKHPALAP